MMGLEYMARCVNNLQEGLVRVPGLPLQNGVARGWKRRPCCLWEDAVKVAALIYGMGLCGDVLYVDEWVCVGGSVWVCGYSCII